jgi:hypothetical protein
MQNPRVYSLKKAGFQVLSITWMNPLSSTRKMKSLVRTIFLTLVAAFALPQANAAEAVITAIPTAWRLQQYVGSVATVWFTGSSCNNGNLSLGAATEAEKNRFWSLVLAAKLSNHSVFVYYETTNCTVTSFGMDG